MATRTTDLNPKTKPLSDTIEIGKIPLGDETILFVKVGAHDRKTIEAWMTYSENIRRGWSDIEKPLFILIDMADKDFSFGRYANQRASKMMQIQPEIPTYIAWVIRESVLANILKASLSIFNRMSSTASFMLVHDLEEGYEWLKTTYEKRSKTKLSV